MPYEPEDQETYERNSTHALIRAVAAERERCAKIASDEQYGDPLGPQESAFNDACSRIHDAILNQKE